MAKRMQPFGKREVLDKRDLPCVCRKGGGHFVQRAPRRRPCRCHGEAHVGARGKGAEERNEATRTTTIGMRSRSGSSEPEDSWRPRLIHESVGSHTAPRHQRTYLAHMPRLHRQISAALESEERAAFKWFIRAKVDDLADAVTYTVTSKAININSDALRADIETSLGRRETFNDCLQAKGTLTNMNVDKTFAWCEGALEALVEDSSARLGIVDKTTKQWICVKKACVHRTPHAPCATLRVPK